MIPAQFDYVRPANLDEALRILKDREGEAKLLSGGYSLLPLIKLRLAQPGLLVDLRDVTGLDGIVETDDDLRIGARATHWQIHENAIVQRPLPAPRRRDRRDRRPAGPQLGDDRRLGRPCRPGVGLAGGAARRERDASCAGAGRASASIAARDFFLGTFETAIEPTEVLTEIRIRPPPEAPGGAYEKLERKVGDFATVGVATVVGLGDDGTIQRAGDRRHRCRRHAVRRDRRRGGPRGQRPIRRPLPPGGRGRGGAEPPVGRHPRSGRLQARDGRGADRAVTSTGRRTRRRVRVAGEPR